MELGLFSLAASSPDGAGLSCCPHDLPTKRTTPAGPAEGAGGGHLSWTLEQGHISEAEERPQRQRESCALSSPLHSPFSPSPPGRQVLPAWSDTGTFSSQQELIEWKRSPSCQIGV